MSCTRPLVVAIALLGIAGCAQTDPFTKAGIWKPVGVNDANIAAQLADPADIARGRPASSGTYRTGASAVDRHWQGGPPRPAAAAAQAAAPGGGGPARPGEAPR